MRRKLRRNGHLNSPLSELLKGWSPEQRICRRIDASVTPFRASGRPSGLSHVKVKKQWTILDIGCGGRRTVGELANAANAGNVHGLDYAQGSIAASRNYNRRLIANGRVHIEHGTVSNLPFSACMFDLVTAIETQYYWPNLQGDMREILRVLKPGGKLLVIAENYKGGRFDWLEGPLMRILLGSSRLRPADQQALFEATGYFDIQIVEERKKGWICVIGTKPSA